VASPRSSRKFGAAGHGSRPEGNSVVRRCDGSVSIGVWQPYTTQREQTDQRDERGDPEEHDGWRAKEKRERGVQAIVRRHVRRGQSPQGGADAILVSGSHAAAGWHFPRPLERFGNLRRRRELRRAAFVR
jgi:hypothetical protein